MNTSTKTTLLEEIAEQGISLNEFKTYSGEVRYYVNSSLAKWDSQRKNVAALLAGVSYTTYNTGNISSASKWNTATNEWESLSNTKAYGYAKNKIYFNEQGEIFGEYLPELEDLLKTEFRLQINN